ncbi:streptophobe family protein, partial [Streptomyces rimosus]|uniref:streptophobe family protein n=1 Tax=Streptomyces rimosus TaxID=1927 RepID=UPI0006C23F17
GGGDGGLLDRLRDGLGGLGIGDGDNGGLPERIADLIGAKASVGFAVDTGASLAGGLVWVLGVLVITVLAARRGPLPPPPPPQPPRAPPSPPATPPGEKGGGPGRAPGAAGPPGAVRRGGPR